MNNLDDRSDVAIHTFLLCLRGRFDVGGATLQTFMGVLLRAQTGELCEDKVRTTSTF